MRITTLGPTQNFAALNPPDWLADDLSRLADTHPHFRLLTLFSGDMQTETEMDMVCTQHFGNVAVFKPYLPPLMEALAGTTGYTCVNLNGVPNEIVPNHLTGKPVAVLKPDKAPDAGIIILPPRQMEPHDFISVTTGVPDLLCARSSDVNLHQAVLGHEWGHALNWLSKPKRFVWRADERMADRHMCSFTDAVTRAFFKDWRCLSNFLKPIPSYSHRDQEAIAQVKSGNTDCSDYWNDLYAAGIKVPAHEEFAAQIELKLRSLKLRPHYPEHSCEFVRRAFNECSLPLFRHRFSTAGQMERLRNLEEDHTTIPYRYKYSSALADLTLNAAYRLVPGLM